MFETGEKAIWLVQKLNKGRFVISDKPDDSGTLFLARPLSVYKLSSSAAFA